MEYSNYFRAKRLTILSFAVFFIIIISFLINVGLTIIVESRATSSCELDVEVSLEDL